MLRGTHAGKPLVVTDEVVRKLVDEQFPHLADQELGRRYTLEDHFAIRIGDYFGAVFPRHQGDDHLYERAADLIAPHTERWTFPASAPIATGKPDHGYPYHWTLVSWISASTAAFVPLQPTSARDLGAALREIHAPAPADGVTSPAGATTLRELLPEWERLLAYASLRGAPENHVLDVEAADALFRVGVDMPIDVPRTWTHGRLEPRSIQSDRGRFCGILIWHQFGVGDPAVDLGGAATVIPLDMRDRLYRGYGDVTVPTAWRAQSYQLLAALRYIEIDDPFIARMAWERLLELSLAREA